MSDLSGIDQYLSPYGEIYSTGVAESADGHYVAVGSGSSDDYTTFGPDSAVPIRTMPVTSGTNPEGRGAMAWIGHELLTGSTGAFSRQPVLHFYTAPLAATSSISLSGPSTHTRATPLNITGTLSSRNVAVVGATVTVSRRDADGTVALPPRTTSGTGQFTITDTPTVGGSVVYTARYAGDATHQAAISTATVTVSKSTPYLAIATDHTLYAYGQTAVVTASLGATYRNRTVSIYATPYGHPLRLLRQGQVDSSGHLRVAYQMLYRTTFIVRFLGDEHFGYTAKAVGARTSAAIHLSVYGWYGSSGSYHLFHAASQAAGLLVRVAPNKSGRCMRFDAQTYLSGSWRNVASLTCETIDGNSATTATFHAGAGFRCRLRAVYGGDGANAAKATPWSYVRFT